MGAAITELLLLVGALTSFRFVSGPTLEVPFGGNTIQTTGYALCENRRPSITLALSAPTIEVTLLHELAHARDCLDDGTINGSLLPAGATLRQPSGHCVANRAELYACWVTEQAQLAGRDTALTAAASTHDD
ncbi:MAG: hypothetical protein IT299_04875 [Dehalococcoidia bacterium]|nr:hypothetical protein [Dehalococcoidia bacterium]